MTNSKSVVLLYSADQWVQFYPKHETEDTVSNLAQCRKVDILELVIYRIKMGTCFCKDRIEDGEPYLAPRSRRATICGSSSCDRNSKNILAEQVNKLVLDTLAMIGSIVDKLVYFIHIIFYRYTCLCIIFNYFFNKLFTKIFA